MKRLNDDEEEQAQRIACSHLVRGCEGAVSELRLSTGETEGGSPTVKRAHVILTQVLSSWRGALNGLTTAEEAGVREAAASNLNGWSSDQLFAETVARRAEDAPALRLMQGVLLEALLTEHDRGLVAGHLQS